MSSIVFRAYAHNLKEPNKSFSKELTLKDIKDEWFREVREARKVIYIDPGGKESVLKHLVKNKNYQ